MGTVKSNRDKFHKPKERLWSTLEMAGPRSILSFNLHKFMRDVVELTREEIGQWTQIGTETKKAQGKRGGLGDLHPREFCDKL